MTCSNGNTGITLLKLEDVAICADSGYILDQFGDICQPASRKMVKNGPKALRRLTKGFEDGRKLAQLSCCCLQSCACLSNERVAELRVFKDFLFTGEL